MQKQDISIVILAAGKGSRMKSNTAKVLHNICGKAMLYHIIKASKEISDDITVVIAHQKESVKEMVQSFFDDIRFVEQDVINYPGTGGALKGIEFSGKKVVVLNGDMPLINPASIEAFLQKPSKIVMSVIELENPDGYGRVIIKNDEVQKIVEQKDANKDELKTKTVNAGVYAFDKDVLDTYIPLLNNDNAQKEYYLTDIIAMAKKDGVSISPLVVDEVIFKGVNSKKDLSEAEIIMQNNIKNKWMQEGVIMQLPHTIYIESDVVFEGECIVENGVRITGESKIINSHIKAHSVIEDSTVKDSDVGPLAHLRPKSSLQDTHIGNFVEVKKSKLTGVKAGHLSYLGDAEIDKGTNIGAGTITCNYDGKNKYKTIIGKNVFVGSDTQLVAPIKIDDDVMIAAGTTLTSDVKKGSLALSRVKVKFIDGFFYKFFGKGN